MEEDITKVVFRHEMPIQIRFNDVDRYGHVNNNAYFSYYDLGKVDYLNAVLGTQWAAGAEVVPVIANINADFFIPVFYGDDIVVETCISHLGSKSFTLLQRAVNRKNGQTVCSCRTVMVCFSLKEQASAALPEAYRKAILSFEAGGSFF